jgi:hypothetical protein
MDQVVRGGVLGVQMEEEKKCRLAIVMHARSTCVPNKELAIDEYISSITY